MDHKLDAIGFAILICLSTPAWSQELTCDQIRAEIDSQVGVPASVNLELLRKISGRTDCRFTASEVYRAAYGDKPFPLAEPGGRRHRDDDDD